MEEEEESKIAGGGGIFILPDGSGDFISGSAELKGRNWHIVIKTRKA